MQKISIILYKVAFKKVNCIFFQNTENRQFFIDNNIAVDKHRLIPGSGVNLEQFQVLEYPPKNFIEFVFISRIMKQKGIDEYLESADYIRRKYPNTKFHICGFCEEEYEGKLKKLQDQGIIEYHGMMRDVRTILEKTHCIVHPSYHEGMANALLESAASGRPVSASNISGCLETFDEGISGFGFEVKNTTDLIDKLIKFIELSYEQKKAMGIAGRKKMEKEYDRNIVVKAYIEEIEKIE
jgi:galacturonosyltransferase